MSVLFSMAAFALASSITPGPVNIVALSSGAQFGFQASLRHVGGATLGFTLLLVLIGLGLHELLAMWPFLTRAIQLFGVAFLLFMAYKLATDDGRFDAGGGGQGAVDAVWRNHAVAQPQGLAGLCRGDGGVCRQWRNVAGVAVRGGVLRDLLPVDRLLGLCRDVPAALFEQPEEHEAIQSDDGVAAGRECGLSGGGLSP